MFIVIVIVILFYFDDPFIYLLQNCNSVSKFQSHASITNDVMRSHHINGHGLFVWIP